MFQSQHASTSQPNAFAIDSLNQEQKYVPGYLLSTTQGKVRTFVFERGAWLTTTRAYPDSPTLTIHPFSQSLWPGTMASRLHLALAPCMLGTYMINSEG
jgi:hypothetical protein